VKTSYTNTRKISQLVNKMCSHCLFPVVDKSGTSCYHLVTRLMRPTDSQQVVPTRIWYRLHVISCYRPDAIWQRDANFQFSMTFNFNIFLCFSNIRNHLSNFSYLVCISCKIFIRWRFYLFFKTENSRRVVESRSVCTGLYTLLKIGWWQQALLRTPVLVLLEQLVASLLPSSTL
jgi:hypothetical protein